MPRYMLDINTVSYIFRDNPPSVRGHLRRVPMGQVCISAITEAELLVGVAQKPEAKALAGLVKEFLLRVDVLDWDSSAARSYAELFLSCRAEGKSLSALDMLIAAHAMAVGATLVTSDSSFYKTKVRPRLADWTR